LQTVWCLKPQKIIRETRYQKPDHWGQADPAKSNSKEKSKTDKRYSHDITSFRMRA
jgi:hypothetical protein